MTPYAMIPTSRNRVADANFHREARKFLDPKQGTAVTISQDGQDDIVLAPASYLTHLERLATHHILDGLDLTAVAAAEMSDEHAAILEGARPAPDEFAADRWNADATSRNGDVFEYAYRFKADRNQERDEIRIRPVIAVAASATRLFTVAVAWEADNRPGAINMDDRFDLTRGGAAAIGEYNHLSSLGYDIRPVIPAVSPVVGRIPPSFLDLIISGLLRGREATVDRNRPR